MSSVKPKVYLETSVPSYLIARPSRDLVTLAHQEITLEWWERRRHEFELFVSETVIAEVSAGDESAAHRRQEAIRELPVLRVTDDVVKLARAYLESLPIPPSAVADAFHLAFASVYAMEFLVTWNCRHIACGPVMQALPAANKQFGLGAPVICTPEELLYGNHEED